MSVIIRMDSKELMKDFLPFIDDHKDFQFITISENVTTSGKHENVKSIPRLIPPQEAVNEFIEGNKKRYKQLYFNYLSNQSIEAFIYIIVKAAVENNLRIVLLCSEFESEFNYLKQICQHIEEVFQLKTHTLKSYMKDPKKAEKISNLDEVKEILNAKFKKLENSGISLDTKKDDKDLAKELKKLKRKELKKIAKKNKVKIKKDMGKKDIIKKLIKKKNKSAF